MTNPLLGQITALILIPVAERVTIDLEILMRNCRQQYFRHMECDNLSGSRHPNTDITSMHRNIGADNAKYVPVKKLRESESVEGFKLARSVRKSIPVQSSDFPANLTHQNDDGYRFGKQAQGMGGENKSNGKVMADVVSVKVSPYVILPDDKLVFGWQAALDSDALRYASIPQLSSSMTISPGAGKITLWGSYVSNDKQYFPSLNQNTTSDSVHEAIHYDNPVLDQFDTQDRFAFKGSLADAVITGSIRDEPFSPGARRIIGQSSEGTAYAGGTLNRNTTLISDERYYDSMPPELASVFQRDNIQIPIVNPQKDTQQTNSVTSIGPFDGSVTPTSKGSTGTPQYGPNGIRNKQETTTTYPDTGARGGGSGLVIEYSAGAIKDRQILPANQDRNSGSGYTDGYYPYDGSASTEYQTLNTTAVAAGFSDASAGDQPLTRGIKVTNVLIGAGPLASLQHITGAFGETGTGAGSLPAADVQQGGLGYSTNTTLGCLWTSNRRGRSLHNSREPRFATTFRYHSNGRWVHHIQR